MTNRFAIDRGITPCVRLTLTMPKCTRTYGVSPCTAPLATTAGRCFNTWATCLDRPNYDGSGKREFRFITEGDFLTGWKQTITNVQHQPPKLKKDWKLWERERFIITLKDFVQERENEDDDEWHGLRANAPYGTSYWARWIARNKHFNRRPALVEIGSVSGGAFIPDSVHHLFLESADYNEKRGMSFTLYDGIKIAKEDGAFCPKVRVSDAIGTIKLTAEVDDSATTTTLPATAVFPAPPPEYVSVGGEIMRLVSQTSTPAPTGDNPNAVAHALTIQRAQGGSPIRSHDSGDTIQECYSKANANVVDVVRELLSPPFASLPVGVAIDDTTFNFEKSGFLATYGVTNIIAKPEATADLLAQLQESCLFRIYYNSATRKIEMKSIVGLSAEGEVSQAFGDNNIEGGSLTITEEPRQSISAVYIHTRPENYADTSRSKDKWTTVEVYKNADIESPNARGEETAHEIYSRWITPSLAVSVGERLLLAGGDNEVLVVFETAHRNQVRLGQNFPFNSRRRTDAFGGELQESYRVLRVASLGNGRRLKITAQKTIYGRGALESGVKYFTIGESTIGGEDVLL